jgi:hypothetical protein
MKTKFKKGDLVQIWNNKLNYDKPQPQFLPLHEYDHGISPNKPPNIDINHRKHGIVLKIKIYDDKSVVYTIFVENKEMHYGEHLLRGV